MKFKLHHRPHITKIIQQLLQRDAWTGVDSSLIPAESPANTFALAAIHKRTTINLVKFARALSMEKGG
jgi:hypothetical protein